MRGRPAGLALWLLVLAAAEVAAFVVVWRFFVTTRRGQLLDTVALTGNSIGQARIQDLVDTVLNALSAVSLAVATGVIGFIALVRRRAAVAFGAILLVLGANLTAQLLKVLIARPELGVDEARAAAGNSLPSGHTTIAASVAVALVLVLPARVRGVGGVIGAGAAALAGVATLSAGWHRPSDAVAALLLVGAWAAVAGLVILVAQRHHGGVEYGPANRYAAAALGLAAVVALAAAGLALGIVDQTLATPPDELGRRRLFAGYAGGALGIAGTASLAVALVLATVHRVVPLVVPGAAGTGALPAVPAGGTAGPTG